MEGRVKEGREAERRTGEERQGKRKVGEGGRRKRRRMGWELVCIPSITNTLQPTVPHKNYRYFNNVYVAPYRSSLIIFLCGFGSSEHGN